LEDTLELNRTAIVATVEDLSNAQALSSAATLWMTARNRTAPAIATSSLVLQRFSAHLAAFMWGCVVDNGAITAYLPW
jgi:hypothetical protein